VFLCCMQEVSGSTALAHNCWFTLYQWYLDTHERWGCWFWGRST